MKLRPLTSTNLSSFAEYFPAVMRVITHMQLCCYALQFKILPELLMVDIKSVVREGGLVKVRRNERKDQLFSKSETTY